MELVDIVSSSMSGGREPASWNQSFVQVNKELSFYKNHFKVTPGWQVFLWASDLNDCIPIIINCFPLDCIPLYTLLILSFGWVIIPLALLEWTSLFSSLMHACTVFQKQNLPEEFLQEFSINIRTLGEDTALFDGWLTPPGHAVSPAGDLAA